MSPWMMRPAQTWWIGQPEEQRDCCDTRINEYHLRDCPRRAAAALDIPEGEQ